MAARFAKPPSRRKSTRRETPKHVHRFLIALREVDPLVWRRIQVPESYSFWDFHVAIQDAMGWEDRHLHEFCVFDDKTGEVVSIGIPTDETPPDRPVIPGWTVPLSRYIESREWHGVPMLYAYDFGDDWQHVVLYEGTEPAQRSTKYPRCVSGERCCPPEDCGGPHSYAEFLKIITTPRHPEHREMREWIGKDYDPNDFDPGRVVFDDPQKRWKRAFDL